MEFNFYIPTRLIFGQGSFSAIGEETSKLGKRALLVTYPSQSLVSYVQQAVDLLGQHGVSTVVFAEATANPTHTMVNRGSRLAREEGLFAGTSTGANVIAALRLAEQSQPHATIVTVMCDTGMKYLDTFGIEGAG